MVAGPQGRQSHSTKKFNAVSTSAGRANKINSAVSSNCIHTRYLHAHTQKTAMKAKIFYTQVPAKLLIFLS